MNKRETGTEWERVAAEYLAKQGMRIVETNFRSRQGEIDLIGYHQGYLVFVEVKYRAQNSGGHPLEAVDARKQQRIGKTADFYLLRYGYGETTPCRFDVVGILGDEVIHLRNAFER